MGLRQKRVELKRFLRRGLHLRKRFIGSSAVGIDRHRRPSINKPRVRGGKRRILRDDLFEEVCRGTSRCITYVPDVRSGLQVQLVGLEVRVVPSLASSKLQAQL